MDEIRVGFDVGVHGAIAVFKNDELYFKRAFPFVEGEEKKIVDYEALAAILLEIAILSEDIHCCIEHVHAIYGSSAGSTFMFGRQFGFLEGLVSGMGLPYTLVTPQMWQAEMWKGIKRIKLPKKTKTGKERNDTKAISELAAKTLFPDADFRADTSPTSRQRKAHDGIVDAVLIAEYCRRMCKEKKVKEHIPTEEENLYKHGYIQN